MRTRINENKDYLPLPAKLGWIELERACNQKQKQKACKDKSIHYTTSKPQRFHASTTGCGTDVNLVSFHVACTRTHTHACTHMHAHTRAHTCMHTHIHAPCHAHTRTALASKTHQTGPKCNQYHASGSSFKCHTRH